MFELTKGHFYPCDWVSLFGHCISQRHKLISITSLKFLSFVARCSILSQIVGVSLSNYFYLI